MNATEAALDFAARISRLDPETEPHAEGDTVTLTACTSTVTVRLTPELGEAHVSFAPQWPTHATVTKGGDLINSLWEMEQATRVLHLVDEAVAMTLKAFPTPTDPK